MAKDRNQLKAGLFIVISVILIIAVIVGIKGTSHLLQPLERFQVRFSLADDIGGLAEGDQVRIGGAKVGSIRNIELETESDKPGTLITFEVPRKFSIKQDAVVTIQTTVTGVSVLNFESLGHGAPLAKGDILTGKAGASLTAVAAVAAGFLTDARAVTLPKINSAIDTYKATGDHATDFIAYVKSKIDPIIERYNQFADKGTYALGEVGALFGDTRPDFRGTMKNLNAATGSVKDKLPGILEKTDGTLTKISNALDKINSALVNIREVAENTRDATASARSILTTNRGKIDAMIASLKTVGDNLKFATAEIRRSPWRLLYKPGPGEMANLNLYDSARQFAEGAAALQDASVALRDALKDKDVDPKQIEKLVEQLDKSFEEFMQVESALWKSVKE